MKLHHGDIKATQGDTEHAQADIIWQIYAHILDEDRKINAQRFEAAFYANPDLRGVRAPVETSAEIPAQAPAPSVDIQAVLAKLQQSPELLTLLTALVGLQKGS